MKIIWTINARMKLREIREYISQDSMQNAVVFLDFLVKQVQLLEASPQTGRIVPEFNDKAIRELVIKKYRIVYRILETEIHILTVFEGHKLLSFS